MKTLASMSIEEKIGQMILVYNSPLAFLEKHHVGGVLIMSDMLRNPEKLATEIKNAQSKLPIKLLVTIDQEGGKVNRLSRMEKWKSVPTAWELGSLNPDSILAITHGIAQTLKELGVNVNLAPVLDPTHNFENKPVFMGLNGRSFGAHAGQIVPPAKVFIKGFSEAGILCISKHFPGYDVPDNSDHFIAVSQADSNTVLENTLAFKETIGMVGGVMMSSILYPRFADRPAVFSPKIVAWARGMDDEKIIMTDDLWGAALRGHVSKHEKVDPLNYPDQDFSRLIEMAFLAGNDMLMITFPKKVEIMVSTITRICQENPDQIKRLDASVIRILHAKQRIGLL